MTQVNMYEAKTHFAELIRQARMGEDVIIAKAGKPMVRLVPVNDDSGKRKPGSAQNEISITGDFNDPLPGDIEGAFYK